jgi:hypothetical protein
MLIILTPLKLFHTSGSNRAGKDIYSFKLNVHHPSWRLSTRCNYTLSKEVMDYSQLFFQFLYF